MIAEFNHFDIKERIIDFFQNIFIVKKKLTDKRIIHYFEWGNKNIHFYDVTTHKQSKYLVDFKTIFLNFVGLWLVIMEDSFALREGIKTMFVVIGC